MKLQQRIITVKGFGYPVLIHILSIYFSVYSLVFVSIQNFVKNTPLRVVFSTLFTMFEYSDETLSRV